MRRPNPILALFLSVVVLLLLYAFWKIGLAPAADACAVCGRELHVETTTRARVEGQPRVFCCPTCALTAHQQTGGPIQITEFTDLDTRRPLLPHDAYLVRGSDLNFCVQQHVHMGADKHPATLGFDRCSPSILALSTPDAAARLMDRYGGELLRYADLEADYRR